MISVSGYVTPVLSQGTCASCAAHSAASTIESCIAISSVSFPVPVSQQQLIDCTKGVEDGVGTILVRENKGCVYGFADLHLKWLNSSTNTLQNPQNYPLTQTEGECRQIFGYDYYNGLPEYNNNIDTYNYNVKRQVQ